MGKITAAITGVGQYLPEYILTNDELSQMVDTNDEWIMSHTGIKTRHILKGEGVGRCGDLRHRDPRYVLPFDG